MNRLVRALGLCLALAGCTAAAPTTQPQPLPVPPTQPAAGATETDPAAPTSTASKPAVATGLIAYELDGRMWVMDEDGTDARELLPDVPGNQHPIAWSRDGSRLLYSTLVGLALTDAGGSEPMEFVLPCPPGADSDPVISSCQVDMGGVALSPDGTRLAYPIWEGSHDQGNREVASTLIVMDVATVHATRLESTRATTPSLACGTAANEGENRSPSWSPNGKRLVFARDVRSAASGDCPQGVMTVDADGSNVRQILAPGSLQGLEVRPIWSPDGESILVGTIFNSGSGARQGWGGSIYAVRPGGTGLTALTSDGASVWPTWTRDGRITFVRWLSPADAGGDPWVMDAEGGNATRLEATIPSLTAAGCLVCAYPMQFDGSGPVIDPLNVRQTPPLRKYETATMLWQPVQGAQP